MTRRTLALVMLLCSGCALNRELIVLSKDNVYVSEESAGFDEWPIRVRRSEADPRRWHAPSSLDEAAHELNVMIPPEPLAAFLASAGYCASEREEYVEACFERQLQSQSDATGKFFFGYWLSVKRALYRNWVYPEYGESADQFAVTADCSPFDQSDNCYSLLDIVLYARSQE